MERNLTQGSISRSLILFSLPMILGNLIQQLYNVADTLIVGKTIGPTALSAVGSSYSLMTLLTSVILGLCMGSGVVLAGEETQAVQEVLGHISKAAFLLESLSRGQNLVLI